MKALVVHPGRAIALEDVAVPASASECLVRVSMAGICGTDLQILEGYAGFAGIPGHEFVGVVETAPAADAHWVGKRVVGEINVGCGRCEWCRRNVKEHCTSRSVVGIRHRGGAFAEYVALPAENLHHVPDTIGDRSAVFVEPVAAACRIFEQMPVAAGSRIAIVGDGRMGLLVAQVVRTVAPDVTLFGRHEDKLAVARALGLTVAGPDEATTAHSFDIVVDVTGRPAGLTRALELVRPRGVVVLKSTFHGAAPLESWPIVVDEVTLVGSRCGPFPPAIALLASGAIAVEPLIARVTTIEDHRSAFADARTALKVLFDLSADA
jgi:threonine dehydrogenase-like Zn-dependent dehydrogenase